MSMSKRRLVNPAIQEALNIARRNLSKLEFTAMDIEDSKVEAIISVELANIAAATHMAVIKQGA